MSQISLLDFGQTSINPCTAELFVSIFIHSELEFQLQMMKKNYIYEKLISPIEM